MRSRSVKTIGAFDAKTHLSQYLAEVEQTGSQICIQKRGRSVAVLKPYQNEEDAEARADELVQALRDIRETQGTYAPGNAETLRDEGRKR
jgi:prevent-host-death family protein